MRRVLSPLRGRRVGAEGQCQAHRRFSAATARHRQTRTGTDNQAGQHNWRRNLTTPDGRPTEAKPLQYKGFGPGDAAVQAGAGGATVRSSNQDISETAQADAAYGQSMLLGGVANEQGQPFTGNA